MSLPAALHGIELSWLASEASILYPRGGLVSSSALGWCWCCPYLVGWAYWV